MTWIFDTWDRCWINSEGSLNMKPRFLLIPDVAPLISLARADSLDLLCKLEATTLLVFDNVFINITFENRYPESQDILDFLLMNAAVFFTPEVSSFLFDLDMQDAQSMLDKGEIAVYRFLRKLNDQKVFWTRASTLVLFEDTAILNSIQLCVDQFKQTTRLITTPSYIRLMEAMHFIPSADTIFARMKRAGE